MYDSPFTVKCFKVSSDQLVETSCQIPFETRQMSRRIDAELVLLSFFGQSFSSLAFLRNKHDFQLKSLNSNERHFKHLNSRREEDYPFDIVRIIVTVE